MIREILVCTRSSDPPYGLMDGPVQDRMLQRRDSYSEAPYKRNSGTETDRYHRGMANNPKLSHKSHKCYKLDPDEAGTRTLLDRRKRTY